MQTVYVLIQNTEPGNIGQVHVFENKPDAECHRSLCVKRYSKSKFEIHERTIIGGNKGR